MKVQRILEVTEESDEFVIWMELCNGVKDILHYRKDVIAACIAKSNRHMNNRLDTLVLDAVRSLSLELKRPVKMAEILAWFAKHSSFPKRGSVATMLYFLRNRGLIEQKARGLYFWIAPSWRRAEQITARKLEPGPHQERR